ncbi:LAFE_0H14752g1_1 [Lachancea fermentati]|uniref:LAFE_0H14752g1_1 n=1 Tax=Lachancea fermentati TaxID=4955 RepID=A0A1G4MKV0_LACFM|nr:LAFE_0H14752g1_1 [Lachancea fermentati]
MDGLLINTEDIYTVVTNEVLAEHGKGPLTWDVKIQLQGLPGREASKKVIEHFQLPLTYEEFEKINVEKQNHKWATCEFLPGALELIQLLKAKDIPIALCTSSAKYKFEGKTGHLKDTFSLFDVVITGDDPRIPPGRGKPYPDIWKLGLQELNKKFDLSVKPEECIIFEDGVPGVTSAKAAGAYVVWVPHPEAHKVLGDTASILDGKGELLQSLELFNSTKFGL